MNPVQEKLSVYRKGITFRVRSSWSETEDLVIMVWLGNETSWLVPKGSDIRRCTEYTMLHCSTDDFPASLFGGYGYLSGNHGSPWARRIITGRGNEFTEADLGKLLTDEAGNRFRIVEARDLVAVLIHPENTGTLGSPVFADYQGQPLFYEDGTPVYVQSWKRVQLHPCTRILKQEFLLDGKISLPENKVMECTFLEHHLVHEVVSPGDIVKWVVSHGGKKTSPAFSDQWGMAFDNGSDLYREYQELPSLIRMDARFTYQSGGAQVTDRTMTCHAGLESIACLEQMLGWVGVIKPADKEGKYFPDAVEDMYIPKLKKMELPRKNGEKILCDFARIVSILPPFDIDYLIPNSDAEDLLDLPDRFIRLTGRGRRQYGIALGYSLFDGCTARGNTGVPRPGLFRLYPTKKMYPQAYRLEHTLPGQQIRCVSYKQYFNPEKDPDFTDFYIHREGASDVVYMDCHKPLKGKHIVLPAYLAGKEITVLEKTPSVVFSVPEKVPSGGLILDVNGNHGSLVLKLD